MSTTTHPIEFKRPKLYEVPFSQMRLAPDNVRFDMGDMEWLINNILEEGVKEVMHGYSKTIDGTRYFYIVDGNRRYLALKWIFENKCIDIRANCLPSIDEKNQEQAIVDRYLHNTGKNNNPLEKSHYVGKLIKYKWEVSKIAAALSISETYVNDLYTLYCAPKGLHDLIIEGRLKGTFAIELLKEKDFDVYVFLADVKAGKYNPPPEPQMTLDNLVLEGTESENKTIETPITHSAAKITKRVVTGGVNSLKSFKKWAKAPTTFAERIPAEKKPIYDFMVGLLNDQYSEKDIIEFFNQD